MGLLACMEQNREPEDKKERKKERLNGKEDW
jgi:hypothetical protein